MELQRQLHEQILLEEQQRKRECEEDIKLQKEGKLKKIKLHLSYLSQWWLLIEIQRHFPWKIYKTKIKF